MQSLVKRRREANIYLDKKLGIVHIAQEDLKLLSQSLFSKYYEEEDNGHHKCVVEYKKGSDFRKLLAKEAADSEKIIYSFPDIDGDDNELTRKSLDKYSEELKDYQLSSTLSLCFQF